MTEWTRPVRPYRPCRPVEQPRNSVSMLFYSYPPRVIAEWCGVSLHHANRLKAGTTKPSKSVLRLFKYAAELARNAGDDARDRYFELLR